MKPRYWSCSKFANWLRGTPKPPHATLEEWESWRRIAKSKKVRYWLAENGLSYAQNFVCWPRKCSSGVRHYIQFRWILKTHTLTSELKRGDWHEFDERILHAVFDELVKFVEIEHAWMRVVFSKEERKKYGICWYHSLFRLRPWRSPEAGVAQLEWAAGLKNEWADKDDPRWDQPTRQALVAQEILALYRWWKQERSKNFDPSEEQQEEDTINLIRLIKIRQQLYT